MELTLPALALLVAAPLVLGCALLRLIGIGWRTDRVAYLGWAWLGGSVGLCALEVLRLLAGTDARATVAGGALVLAAVALVRARGRPVLEPEAPPGIPSGRLERAFFALVLALALGVMLARILASSLSAVITNDEAATWAVRAKYLFDAGGFGGSYARGLVEGDIYNTSYPLLNPLLQLWVFDCAGAVTHTFNRLPIQLCAVALVLCSAAAVRRVARPWVAALLVLMLVDCVQLDTAVRRANADVLVALGALVAADAWRRNRAEARASWLGLLSLALVFLVWSKREGLMLLAFGVLVLAVAAWRGGGLRRAAAGLAASRAWWLLVPPLLVQAGTMLHNRRFATSGSHELGGEVLVKAWERLGESLPLVLSFFGEQAVRASFHAIPAAFLVLVVVAWRPRRPLAFAFVPPIVGLFALALLVAFLKGNTAYDLKNAGARVLFQVVPLQLLWIAAAVEALLVAARARGREE
jgi:hypothetical protein